MIKSIKIALSLFIVFTTMIGCSIFEEKKVIIHFENNNGYIMEHNIMTNTKDVEVKKEKAVDKLPILTKNEHEFNGWYYEEDFITPVTFPFKVNKDTTLYAKFTSHEEIVKSFIRSSGTYTFNKDKNEYVYEYKYANAKTNTLALLSYGVKTGKFYYTYVHFASDKNFGVVNIDFYWGKFNSFVADFNYFLEEPVNYIFVYAATVYDSIFDTNGVLQSTTIIEYYNNFPSVISKSKLKSLAYSTINVSIIWIYEFSKTNNLPSIIR